ncbi:MAG: hypothetical protein ABIQ05_09105 [Candidatus Limnocylindria bacterium]
MRPRTVSRARPRRAADRRKEVASVTGFLVAIAAAVGLGLFYLSQSSHVAATGYEINAMQAQMSQLRAEEQQLIFQIGEARSPSVIEDLAQQRLYLVPLSQSVVRFAQPLIDQTR